MTIMIYVIILAVQKLAASVLTRKILVIMVEPEGQQGPWPWISAEARALERKERSVRKFYKLLLLALSSWEYR